LAEQYFSRQPSSPSTPRSVHMHVRGQDFTLTSDSGVFSKAGLDFGTRLLLESVALSPEDGSFVDLGCGYGVVGLVLATSYRQSKWTLVDVNERAVELARSNTRLIGNRVTVVQSDGFSGFSSETFDGVILNPPVRAGKSVIYRLFSDSHRVLKLGSSLWVVMHKKHGVASAASELGRLFASTTLVDRKSGYQVIRCVR